MSFSASRIAWFHCSMRVWRSTLLDLRRLVEKAGAFRSVRTWELALEGGSPLLYRAGRRRPVRPSEVVAPSNDPSPQRPARDLSD